MYQLMNQVWTELSVCVKSNCRHHQNKTAAPSREFVPRLRDVRDVACPSSGGILPAARQAKRTPPLQRCSGDSERPL